MKPGYICAMLFIIPGFPFITSGIDLAKLDLRSGLERLTYALIIILVATMGAWITAMILKLQPEDFIAVHLGTASRLIFRLCASFCGVLGFSIMFNSSIPMASTAAMIGAVANTLRLSLVDFTGMPAGCSCIYRGTGSWTAGVADQKKQRISKNFTYSSFNCYYGAGIVFLSRIL